MLVFLSVAGAEHEVPVTVAAVQPYEEYDVRRSVDTVGGDGSVCVSAGDDSS